LNYAKSIARLTPNLEKEFLEVCIKYSIVVHIPFHVSNIYVAIPNQKVMLPGENLFCCLHAFDDVEVDTWKTI
jgi:hypothetical protein